MLMDWDIKMCEENAVKIEEPVEESLTWFDPPNESLLMDVSADVLIQMNIHKQIPSPQS